MRLRAGGNAWLTVSSCFHLRWLEKCLPLCGVTCLLIFKTQTLILLHLSFFSQEIFSTRLASLTIPLDVVGVNGLHSSRGGRVFGLLTVLCGYVHLHHLFIIETINSCSFQES